MSYQQKSHHEDHEETNTIEQAKWVASLCTLLKATDSDELYAEASLQLREWWKHQRHNDEVIF